MDPMSSPPHAPDPEIPEGISSDARATWPSQELIDSFLGGSFELHPGEESVIDLDDPVAVAQARAFRDTMGRFCSGVTVVTAMSQGKPVGMTLQSFTSVSLSPQLILISPAKTSRAWPLMQRAGSFCVNILAVDQAAVSNTMATKGADKFAEVSWSPSAQTGSPVLDGTLGHIDCSIHAVYEAGDHYLVVGRVRELVTTDKTEPLLFFQGRYRGLLED